MRHSRGLLAGLIVASALGLVRSSASADDPDRREHGMKIVGFDREIANRHGYEIVDLPDGATASVPFERVADAIEGRYRPERGVLPKNYGPDDDAEFGLAEGDCGVSWVQLKARGASTAELVTGFEVVAPVASMNWNVGIHDNGGSSTQHFEESQGFPQGNGWRSEFRILGLTVGPADATIEWYTSYALLTNGWLCFSLGPTAITNIY